MPLDREKNSLLLDYYGVLLTRHQQDILDEYFNEDLSMNEIADNLQISKSAVQDLIKRSLTQLNEFEKKLKLIARDQKLNNILEEMKKQDDKKITDLIRPDEIETVVMPGDVREYTKKSVSTKSAGRSAIR